jgi:preprotein translocase subunit SecG
MTGSTVLHILFFIAAAVLVVATLLQGGKSAGASGAIMGGGMNLFSNVKERGIEKVVSRITLISGICFMTLAILIKIMK